MGFNKKYVDRGSILSNLERIDTFFDSADTIICMDSWSSNFLSNYFPKERDIKRRIEEKFRFDSGVSYHTDQEYKSLKSVSDCLIGLSTQPTWLEINLTIDILKLTPDPETESGKFDILKSKCLHAIIEHFDKN